MKNVRILIADDHEVLRDGVQRLIERQAGWEVCATAITGREAVEKTEKLRPDVVLLDLSMPELNGLEAARQIKRRVPETELLIFTAHETDDVIREAFAAGVKGFVLKSDAASHLIDAIKALSQHQLYFTGVVSSILFDKALRPPLKRAGEATRDRLTARERELLQLVAEGKSNKEVADALGIGVRTAEKHRATVMSKLDIQSVAGLTRYAIRNKIIEP
jgi:DNA-binding NarL/FixJ family response regulator